MIEIASNGDTKALMWRIGAGFNQGYLSQGNGNLVLPQVVTHVELGLAELSQWREAPHPRAIDLSLHLARTPITENREEQDTFLKHLQNQLRRKKTSHQEQITSIGVHLTGPRDEGIGRLGFSSHYNPSKSRERNAIRFVKKLQDMTGLPVWIENANFYSRSIHEILGSWKSAERVCRAADGHLIVDLSHLLIDARNNGLASLVLLGIVPWDLVVELHISGVISGPDGALHDGHSVPVHESVWDLLRQCRDGLLEERRGIIVTIEHTDPPWQEKIEEHNADFERLVVEMSAASVPEGRADQAETYAKSYLKKLLRQWIPKLGQACEQRHISFDQLVEEWLAKVVEKNGQRIVLTSEEVPLDNKQSVSVAAPSFAEFARERIRACDAV